MLKKEMNELAGESGLEIDLSELGCWGEFEEKPISPNESRNLSDSDKEHLVQWLKDLRGTDDEEALLKEINGSQEYDYLVPKLQEPLWVDLVGTITVGDLIYSYPEAIVEGNFGATLDNCVKALQEDFKAIDFEFSSIYFVFVDGGFFTIRWQTGNPVIFKSWLDYHKTLLMFLHKLKQLSEVELTFDTHYSFFHEAEKPELPNEFDSEVFFTDVLVKYDNSWDHMLFEFYNEVEVEYFVDQIPKIHLNGTANDADELSDNVINGESIYYLEGRELMSGLDHELNIIP